MIERTIRRFLMNKIWLGLGLGMLRLIVGCGSERSEAEPGKTSQGILSTWLEVFTVEADPNPPASAGASGSSPPPPVITYLRSKGTPSLAALSNQISVFTTWHEPSTPNHLMHSFDDGTWHLNQPLGGDWRSSPASVAWGDGRVDAVGIGADHAMAHVYYAVNWGWVSDSLGGWFDYNGPVAVSSWASGRLDVFGVAVNSLWHKWYDNGQWGGGWELLGGSGSIGNGGLAAVSTVNGQIDIFAMFNDRKVYTMRWDNGWTAWQELGSPPNGVTGTEDSFNALSAARDPQGHAVVFCQSPDRRIYRRTYPYDLGWVLLGTGDYISAGSLTAVGRTDHIELFA